METFLHAHNYAIYEYYDVTFLYAYAFFPDSEKKQTKNISLNFRSTQKQPSTPTAALSHKTLYKCHEFKFIYFCQGEYTVRKQRFPINTVH